MKLHRKGSRLLAFLLALVMVLGTLPFGAFTGTAHAVDIDIPDVDIEGPEGATAVVVPFVVDASALDPEDVSYRYELMVEKETGSSEWLDTDGRKAKIQNGQWMAGVPTNATVDNPAFFTLKFNRSNNDAICKTQDMNIKIYYEESADSETGLEPVVEFKEIDSDDWQVLDKTNNIVPTFVLEPFKEVKLTVPVQKIVEGTYEGETFNFDVTYAYTGPDVDVSLPKAVLYPTDNEVSPLSQTSIKGLKQNQATGNYEGTGSLQNVVLKHPGVYELFVSEVDVPDNYICKTNNPQVLRVEVVRNRQDPNDPQLYIKAINGQSVGDTPVVEATVGTPYEFVNQRITEDMGSVDIEVPFKKVIHGENYPTDAEFQFRVVADKIGARLPKDNLVKITGEGEGAFNFTFYQPGDWSYAIEEVNVPEGFGPENDGKQRFTIHVEEGEDGTLQASYEFNEGLYWGDGYEEGYDGLIFVNNYYKEPVTIEVPVVKYITGETPKKEGRFTFKLEALNEGENVPLPENTTLTINTKDMSEEGTQDYFDPIVIKSPGKYLYRIKEVAGKDASYTYDKTEYAMVISVWGDSWSGNLHVGEIQSYIVGEGDVVSYWPQVEIEHKVTQAEEEIVYLMDEAITTMSVVIGPPPIEAKRGYEFTNVYKKTSNGGGGGGIGVVPDGLNTEDHYSYIVGYPDGNVRPAANITRAEVASIFFRMLTDEARSANWSQTNNFSDVHTNDWFNTAVSTLTNQGILSGYEDGTFRPNASITRAEFSKIAVSFFKYAGQDFQGYFPDVTAGNWYTSYVEAAKNLGLISGYEDGTFRPTKNISRAEVCTIVNKTLGRNPEKDQMDIEGRINWPDLSAGDWYYAAMMEATNSHDYKWLPKTDDGTFEQWTKKKPQRDWLAIERPGGSADAAPGGEVK